MEELWRRPWLPEEPIFSRSCPGVWIDWSHGKDKTVMTVFVPVLRSFYYDNGQTASFLRDELRVVVLDREVDS
jgi:hypothetical protein